MPTNKFCTHTEKKSIARELHELRKFYKLIK
jgi:hypothetical protein